MLNAFFVAAEFALVKVRATQFHARARKGDKRALAAQEVASKIDRTLAVTQLGITLASLGLGWVGEPAITHLVEAIAMATTGDAVLSKPMHIATVAVGFAFLTFCHVLFGEQVPKLMGLQRTEAIAMFSAGPIRFLYRALWPMLWILERASTMVLRMAGLAGDITDAGLSEDEILGILLANAERTPNGKERSALIERVLRFAQRTSRHAMVPRVDVVSIPVETTGSQAYEIMRAHQYSRLVATKGRSLDDVVGYIYAKDFLLDSEANELENLSKLTRNVLFVPESQGLVDVLREMQREQTPIAVVVDEYGGTSGLLTMEDLLEEIVGEIRDEFDEEPPHFTRVIGEECTWDVDGKTPMEELRPIGIQVSEEDGAEPIGAVILARLGRLARVGDKVDLGGGVTADIMGISRRRVTKVRIRTSA